MLLPWAVERITHMKCLTHRICSGNGVSYLFLAFGQYADTPREATLVIRMTGVKEISRKKVY